MSIIPTDSTADDANLYDSFFNHPRQFFNHLFHNPLNFNFPSLDDHPFFPSSSPPRTLPYSELSIDTDGSLNACLECNEIPDAFLFVANLHPGVQQDQLAVQVDDGDGSPALRISGDGDGAGWGRFNWSLKLPPNARMDQLASSVENGVLTVVVPKVAPLLLPPSPPPRRNVRVVDITGSDD